MTPASRDMKVVTFGEIMLRLSPADHRRLVQAQSLDATFGGGEANVAVSLAHYGMEASFVTKLPRNQIGTACLNHLRRYGVNTEYIVQGGDRLGIYFLERGASQRPSKVIYDRAGSSISEMRPDEVSWERIFQDATWFHWTGITPALGDRPLACIREACRAADRSGVRISCDLNFRGKLWTEEEAQSVMRPLMEYVDVCIGNEEDAERSLGIPIPRSDVEAGQLDEEAYEDLAGELKREFDFDTVAISLRESFSASVNGWSALLHDNEECREPKRSRQYEVHLVDRVGGGDAFAGGLIYGLLTRDDTRQALEFASAASALKQTIPGDFNLSTEEEVMKLATGPGSGRVER